MRKICSALTFVVRLPTSSPRQIMRIRRRKPSPSYSPSKRRRRGRSHSRERCQRERSRSPRGIEAHRRHRERPMSAGSDRSA